MVSRRWLLGAVAAGLLASNSASAGDLAAIDWESIPYTDHQALQAVDVHGVRTYPAGSEGFPIRLRGILLNNPEDMLDATPFSPNPIPFNLGAQWSVVVQSVDVNNTGDFGGTAAFMGQPLRQRAAVSDFHAGSNARSLSQLYE